MERVFRSGKDVELDICDSGIYVMEYARHIAANIEMKFKQVK